MEELKVYVKSLPQTRTSDVAQNRVSAPMAYMLIGKLALWNKDYASCVDAMKEIRQSTVSCCNTRSQILISGIRIHLNPFLKCSIHGQLTGIKKTTQVAAFFTPTKNQAPVPMMV